MNWFRTSEELKLPTITAKHVDDEFDGIGQTRSEEITLEAKIKLADLERERDNLKADQAAIAADLVDLEKAIYGVKTLLACMKPLPKPIALTDDNVARINKAAAKITGADIPLPDAKFAGDDAAA